MEHDIYLYKFTFLLTAKLEQSLRNYNDHLKTDGPVKGFLRQGFLLLEACKKGNAALSTPAFINVCHLAATLLNSTFLTILCLLLVDRYPDLTQIIAFASAFFFMSLFAHYGIYSLLRAGQQLENASKETSEVIGRMIVNEYENLNSEERCQLKILRESLRLTGQLRPM